MKKAIFLSFKPEYFRPILYGIKKYEYRRRFCKEATTAYLYLSSPVRKVIGIMELGEPLKTENLIEDFKGTKEYERINNYHNNGDHNAIPIESLQLFKEPISFSKLQEVDHKFKAPMCYLLLENYKEVYELLKNQSLYEKEFVHEHNRIYKDNICVSCKEMEDTLEYKQQDKKYRATDKCNIEI